MPNFLKNYPKEKGRILRNSQRKRYYDKYNFNKEKHYKKWSTREIEIIKFSNDPDVIIAKYLKRSVQAIQIKRCRILGNKEY